LQIEVLANEPESMDKVTLGRVFSEYFGFPYQSSFHQLLHNHPHLSSGAGTIGQKWPQYKGLSPTPLAIKKIYYLDIARDSFSTVFSNSTFMITFLSRIYYISYAVGILLNNLRFNRNYFHNFSHNGETATSGRGPERKFSHISIANKILF
jgi:hypothetical protein